MERRGKRHFFEALSGLRALTIIWVIANHLFRTRLDLFPGIRPLVDFSQQVGIRMDLLFLVSGFLLAHVYLPRGAEFTWSAYRNILWQRFISIYPAHLFIFLVLAAGGLVSFVAGLEIYHKDVGMTLKAIPFHLTLTQSWPGVDWAAWFWNYPAWFISSLWLAYILVTPLAPYVRRLQSWVWVLLFGILGVRLLLSRFPELQTFQLTSQALLGLLTGVACHQLWESNSPAVVWSQENLGKIVGIAAILSLAIGWLPQTANLLLTAGLPLILLGLTSSSSVLSRLLSTRFCLWLGGISFSLYISHALPIRLMEALFQGSTWAAQPFWFRSGIIVVNALLILATAWAVHRWIEKPCKRYLKQRSPRIAAKVDQAVTPPCVPSELA